MNGYYTLNCLQESDKAKQTFRLLFLPKVRSLMISKAFKICNLGPKVNAESEFCYQWRPLQLVVGDRSDIDISSTWATWFCKCLPTTACARLARCRTKFNQGSPLALCARVTRLDASWSPSLHRSSKGTTLYPPGNGRPTTDPWPPDKSLQQHEYPDLSADPCRKQPSCFQSSLRRFKLRSCFSKAPALQIIGLRPSTRRLQHPHFISKACARRGLLNSAFTLPAAESDDLSSWLSHLPHTERASRKLQTRRSEAPYVAPGADASDSSFESPPAAHMSAAAS